MRAMALLVSLKSNPTAAIDVLGWVPYCTSFEVSFPRWYEMVHADSLGVAPAEYAAAISPEECPVIACGWMFQLFRRSTSATWRAVHIGWASKSGDHPSEMMPRPWNVPLNMLIGPLALNQPCRNHFVTRQAETKSSPDSGSDFLQPESSA